MKKKKTKEKKKKEKKNLKPYYFGIYFEERENAQKRGRNFHFFWRREEREITRLSKILSRALLFARALFFVPRVFHRFRSSRRANTVLPPPVSTPEERRGKGEGEKRDATQQRTKTWEEKRKGGKEI